MSTHKATQFLNALASQMPPLPGAETAERRQKLAAYAPALATDFSPAMLRVGLVDAVLAALPPGFPDYPTLRDALRAAVVASPRSPGPGIHAPDDPHRMSRTEAEVFARAFVNSWRGHTTEARRDVALSVFLTHVVRRNPDALLAAEEMEPAAFRNRGDEAHMDLGWWTRRVDDLERMPDPRARWERAEDMLRRLLPRMGDIDRRPTVTARVYRVIRGCRVALGKPGSPIPAPVEDHGRRARALEDMRDAAPAPHGQTVHSRPVPERVRRLAADLSPEELAALRDALGASGDGDFLRWGIGGGGSSPENPGYWPRR